MQLLIVHDDAEVGEQLAGMVRDYTEHTCALVASDAAATEWSQKHSRCHLLLAQVHRDGVDGLSLGGPLSEIFHGLQVLFLPGYPASEQRSKLPGPRSFPNQLMENGSSKRSTLPPRPSQTHRTCFTFLMCSKCVVSVSAVAQSRSFASRRAASCFCAMAESFTLREQ